MSDETDDGGFATMYAAPFIKRAPAAPRPLAISPEEHATRAWLEALVAAGCELRLLDRTVITVDQAVEHMLEAGRKHTGHTVCIEKNSSDGTYININGWIGWL